MNTYRMIARFLTLILALQSLGVIAAENDRLPLEYSSSTDSFLVQKSDQSLKSGSVYLTPTKKDEVLFKASIWGAVQYPGVHYIPVGTRLIDALSIAGGPIERADMDSITLSSHEGKGLNVYNLSLSEALADNNKNPMLKPDDVLVIREDRSYQKATLYLQIGTFVLSAIALGILINNTK